METKKLFEESPEQRMLHSYQRGLAIMYRNARFFRDLVPEIAERGGADPEPARAALDAAVLAIERVILETALLVGSQHDRDQLPSADDLVAEHEASQKG